MPTVSFTVKDGIGNASGRRDLFFRSTHLRHTDGAIISTKSGDEPGRVPVVDGQVVELDLAEGPWQVSGLDYYGVGTIDFTVPPEGGDLWDLIALEIGLPKPSNTEQVRAAVQSWLDDNAPDDLLSKTDADATYVRSVNGEPVGPDGNVTVSAEWSAIDGKPSVIAAGANAAAARTAIGAGTASTVDDLTNATAVGKSLAKSADATAARATISAASTSFLARNARDAGISITGSVDETTKINAYLQDAYNNQREAYFPRGDYLADQIVIPSGLAVVGGGVGGFGINAAAAGTRFRQPIGANKPMVVFTGNLDDGKLQIGPVDISHIMFMGRLENTAGSAIAFQAADGTLGIIQDTTVIKNCIFRYWPQHGIESKAGARPFHVEDVNFLWNGGAGCYFEQSNPNYVQAVCFDNISGDGNGMGLVYFKNLDSHASVSFVAPKSERRVHAVTGVPGQLDAVIFENCDDSKVNIVGGTHISSVPSGANHEPPGAFIVVKGTGKPQIHWVGLDVRVRPTDVAGSPSMIKDEALGYTIPITTSEGFYGGTDGQYRWAHSLTIGREDEPLVGESTLSRRNIASNAVGSSSGALRLTYFTAKKTESVANVRVISGTTAAATPTLCRIGVYEVAANGDLTLVGATANDTTVFAGANTRYTRALTAPFTKIRGRRYAVGILVVAGTVPNFTGLGALNTDEAAVEPRVAGVVHSQSDLPSTVAASSLAISGAQIYAVLTP
ncbi:glycosyl hydrolase family 28-related protein [Gordonia sp. SCSIO 19800]|uniref:glycosyl hydrolase family 28-related protein n=1 Tax=Gordonia sp. SCSIO 19800 TaxID=2826926 RepID=UPI001B838452|nr:glycosyl hydrolase family 28-related protein [Gordonia sp. SCSIO 19800]MBR7191739.1 hypothetical protein [Gordonia sp. SCSIO 19800]